MSIKYVCDKCAKVFSKINKEFILIQEWEINAQFYTHLNCGGTIDYVGDGE